MPMKIAQFHNFPLRVVKGRITKTSQAEEIALWIQDATAQRQYVVCAGPAGKPKTTLILADANGPQQAIETARLYTSQELYKETRRASLIGDMATHTTPVVTAGGKR